MRIQHNIMAMNAYRNYTNNVAAMKKNLEKLSSGYKINRAGDDAAGLAISEKMRAQITGLQTAQKNAKDGISLVQTAEGALTEVHDMLNRMVELATQSANGTYDNTTDRYQMQKEVDQLLEEIDRIADSSNFNGINLLDGTLGLNTDAFSISAGDAFTEATNGGTIDLVAEADVHGGSDVAFQNAQFVVDLKNLEGSIASGGKYKISIGSASITATATTGDANAAATASNIGNLFNGKSVTIGGQKFTVAHNGGKLTFTLATTGSTAMTASEAAKLTDAQVKAVNDALAGATVKVTASGGNTMSSDLDYDHAIQDMEVLRQEVSGGLYGVDVDLSKVVANGNTLTIGSATFTFKMAATDSAINGSEVTLDSRVSASQQIADAVRLLSQNGNFPTNYHVSAKDNKTLHVDAAASNTPWADKASFAASIKGGVTAQPAKAASTKLTVDAGKIQDGNTITVTDGSKTVKYVFGKGTDATDGSVKFIKDKTAQALKDAIGANATLAADGKTINIKAAKAAASVAAPVVLGKGLTLQIGDTSDSWNQLNVAVQDMHSASIGVGNLKIDTEEAAQAAINKIKAAINTVSDVRGTLGATQNRLDHTINNLSVMTENIQDAESTIRDTDVAEEMMAYTKNNILIQSAQAMLAQANQVPQGVLQLLQ